MVRKIIEVFSDLINRIRYGYYFKNISNSIITIINRASFDINDKWFKNLLAISYDEEIKSKYIPELHESNDFERENLTDIINFKQWLGYHINQLRLCENSVGRFKDSYRDFIQILNAEEIKIINADHQFIKQINALKDSLNRIESDLANLKTLLNLKRYDVLSKKDQINTISSPKLNIIVLRQNDWHQYLDKEPKDYYVLNTVVQHHNQVYNVLSTLNRMLFNLKSNTTSKIIAGNAGTGKTHMSAHLIKKISENGDYVLFFKPKQFNGDTINLCERLLQLLQIPPGFTLNEILEKINHFALKHNRRCFFIIDALNETTKSTIGFSSIWRNHLQEFINQIGLFSQLYLVCTLRTSYIDQIWSIRPSSLVEIKGFERSKDLRALCVIYFGYYKINVRNFHRADLRIFRVPLLLDLYCKLINESRTEQKEIELNMTTYLKIFEDYIHNVSIEVQRKLDLQKKRLIKDGLDQSSNIFFKNNDAIISIDEFNDAFDIDDSITTDKSIARAVLDGYLIFIKDAIYRNDEIVKHTQQEVGGYLLAKNLSDRFSSIEALLENTDFNEKVIESDPNKQHQLRLDILKFLIAMRPEIILHLKSGEGIKLSWWYLYNGFSPAQGYNIPSYLLSLSSKELSIEEILNISSNHWFDVDNEFNFHFVAKVLEKLDLWSFDLSWTFFIYKEAEFFYDIIENNKNRLEEKDLVYNKVVAKFIAFSLATTIRELRDLATIYLIEFGKRHPIELLKLTEYSTCLADEYIYERLASCCYGVALIFQNDEKFVQNILQDIAHRVFQLQFAEDATHPVFNYIIIDSFKHLIDLAIFKGVFNLPDSDRERVNNYQFNPKESWITPTEEQQSLINECNEMSLPAPIGMDFGIYTIPRLIDDEYKKRRFAIANVYKRIFELGYQVSGFNELDNEEFKDFYWGHRIYVTEGKIDKLGKKYSWKGFFDYAGVLLLNGKLDVFEKDTDKRYYKRLSDVDIE